MSNFLAIATVTATLRQLLTDAVNPLSATVGTARPDVTGADGPPNPAVNIYLYQVAPNAAYRNEDLPTRRSDGQLVHRPQAALDLYYLLTFYGNDGDLEPQRLLGAVVRTLHAQPILTRKRIQDTINNAAFTYLTKSDLADAVEQVKFTPLSLSIDDMSKLWSVFFQTHYALSVAYQAAVVLIESQATPETALPVRARNVYAVPFQQPFIEQVGSAAGAGAPLVAGGTLRLLGQHLRGERTRVRIGDVEATPVPSDVTETRLDISLNAPPFPADKLRAGVQGVQVVQPRLLGTPPAEHAGFESNVAAFVLHPTITVNASTSTNIDLTVDPKVGARQRVVLLLNEDTTVDPGAYTFAAPPRNADSAALSILISGVPAGTYFVRLQVDGAESLLELHPGPNFGPTVTI
jgi:hypothetical protein